jgi:hypothetical protein
VQIASPRISDGTSAGIGGGAARELAVELAEQCDAVGEAQLGAGRGERGVLRRVRAVDDEACARKGLERRRKARVAHPVVRPGEPRPQREHGVGIERQQAVEARAQFAPGVGAGATGIGKPEAAAVDVGLAVARGAEVLRLDGGIGRQPAEDGREAVATFNPRAEALRVEAGGEMIARKREAVGRHPVIGEGQRRRDIGRTPPARP